MTFQLLLFPEFRDKAVTLSYDDGSIADVRLVEIMNKYRLKGTFNLNSGTFHDENCVQAEDYKKVYLESGHEIAVHGREHLSLTTLSEERIIDEIHSDRVALEAVTGGLVTGMAYAYGAFDDRVVECLKKCGIDYSRTVRSTETFDICDDWLRMPTTCHHRNPKLAELVEKFLEDRKDPYSWKNPPKLFYLWGHSYEFNDYDEWEIIERFADRVGKREDVWYATNGEIYRYVEAYKGLRYGTGNKRVYNPSALDVYIKTFTNRRYRIPAGETVEIE